MKKKNKIQVLGMSIKGQLSRHFILGEMLFSNIANRFNLQNIPTEKEIKAMKYLCANLLEPIRNGVRETKSQNSVLIITSGFRCKEVNKKAGGAKTSRHLYGEAADFYMTKFELFNLFKFIVDSGLEFDQVIWEYDSWIHISIKEEGINRNEILSVKQNRDTKNKWRGFSKAEVQAMQSSEEL